MEQRAIKAPKSVRIIDVVLGAINLILAGAVLAWPSLFLTLLLVVVSVGLLIAGIEGLIIGTAGRAISGGQRAIRVIGGLIAMGLSMAVLIFPAASVLTSVWLLSIAFLVLGTAAIGKGIMEKFMSGWARAMYIVAGGVAVCLSIPMMIYPGFALSTIYSLMATILIVNGGAYVIAGITGAVYVPIGAAALERGKRWESDAA